MKFLCSSKISLLLLGFAAACCLPAVGAATGKTEDSNTDPIGITAGGPRLGPIAVVEVTFPDRHALDELVRAEYDISGVRGNVATIYASLEELERLKQTGYPLREIERQPKPGGFDIMALGGYHSYAALTDELNIYDGGIP